MPIPGRFFGPAHCPPVVAHREPLSMAELTRRVIDLRHETERIVAPTHEAIRRTRATVDECRQTEPLTRPDPH
jgi:hypothetical protein